MGFYTIRNKASSYKAYTTRSGRNLRKAERDEGLPKEAQALFHPGCGAVLAKSVEAKQQW
jgi:hypothetical protein